MLNRIEALPKSLALSELVLSPSSWKPMAVAKYSPRESHLVDFQLSTTWRSLNSPEVVLLQELLHVLGSGATSASLKKNSTSQQGHDGQHLR